MLNRIIAGFLILIVLIGTVGLSYDSHYCGGELVRSELSIVPQKLSCGMSANDQSEDGSESLSNRCCENDHVEFKLDDDFVKYQVAEVSYLIDFTFPIAEFDVGELDLSVSYEFIGYSPPPLVKQDLTIWHQTFLI
jgi:hypothetical protein